jgi:hypothetical protein
MLAPRSLRRFPSWSRIAAVLLAAMALLAVAGCGTIVKSKQNDILRRLQYDYSAAIRWGDIESAWNLVDPEFRKANPMSEVQLSRYKQVQVTGYRDGDSHTAPDGTVMREIQIDVVNRNTLNQRSLRYTEQWRYDVEAKRWWVVGGLPDFWGGQ